jgi:hypothetical protein
MVDKVNIRHIVSLDDRSYCFDETKPDAINRLTGEQIKPIEIYVEDDVAHAITRKICSSLQASRYVKIYMFGAAINAFTLLSSSLIRGENISNKIYILDGDEYSTPVKKAAALDRVLTGTEERTRQLKIEGEGKVIQFNLPENMKPEAYLHQLITTIPTVDLENDALEIITVANNIRFEIDPHRYISKIIDINQRRTGRSTVFKPVVVTAIYLDQLTAAGTPVARLLDFWCELSSGDPESGFYHKASDGFLAQDQTVNFLQLFPGQRGAKIAVAFSYDTQCQVSQ